MDLLLLVTTGEANHVLAPLARALKRQNVNWCAFFTNDGVTTLREKAVVEAIAGAGRAVVCQDSWERYLPGVACPVELGSQTTNSALVAEARRILSL